MDDYISRDAVVDGLNKLCDRVCQYSKAQRYVMCSSCPLGDAFIVIEDDIPDADVRPVVLCRDCKYRGCSWNEYDESCHNPRFGDGWGNYPPPDVRDDFFCADGERKDGT